MQAVKDLLIWKSAVPHFIKCIISIIAKAHHLKCKARQAVTAQMSSCGCSQPLGAMLRLQQFLLLVINLTPVRTFQLKCPLIP